MVVKANNDLAAIERQIAALMQRTEERVPLTRQLLAGLPRIEQALETGVSRAELASVYGVTLQQFNAGLAGARRLKRNGGDGRRRSVRQTTKPKPALPPARGDSLIEKL
jgi:hypothetical protein